MNGLMRSAFWVAMSACYLAGLTCILIGVFSMIGFLA